MGCILQNNYYHHSVTVRIKHLANCICVSDIIAYELCVHILVVATLGEEVDGKTLLHLANHGSIEELKATGFTTIKTQVNLKMLLRQAPEPAAVSMEEKPSTSTTAVFKHKPRKLSRDEIKSLEEGDRRLYLFRLVSMHIRTYTHHDQCVEVVSDKLLYSRNI